MIKADKTELERRLAFVKEHLGTMSIEAMAKELKVARHALDANISRWRKDKLLAASAPRTYTKRDSSGVVHNSAFFDWLDFENCVIVGGNLYSEEKRRN